MVATPASAAPIDLICAQVDCDSFTLPTGSTIYERGAVAHSIYAVRRGIVELLGDGGDKICYRPGEVFCFQDITWEQGQHRSHALARTPVEILRLDRLRFCHRSSNSRICSSEKPRSREWRMKRSMFTSRSLYWR